MFEIESGRTGTIGIEFGGIGSGSVETITDLERGRLTYI